MTNGRAHRSTYRATGVGALLVGGLLLTGCSTGSSGAGTIGTGASKSACDKVHQTLANVPGRLQQAGSSNQPVDNVRNTLGDIRKELDSETSQGTDKLKSAVNDYVDKLQNVVNTAASGKQPDLGKLSTSKIDDACR